MHNLGIIQDFKQYECTVMMLLSSHVEIIWTKILSIVFNGLMIIRVAVLVLAGIVVLAKLLEMDDRDLITVRGCMLITASRPEFGSFQAPDQ